MTTASMLVASSRLTWSGRLASCRPATLSISQWYKSDAVPGPDLLAGDALVRGRRPVGLGVSRTLNAVPGSGVLSEPDSADGWTLVEAACGLLATSSSLHCDGIRSVTSFLG